RLFCVSLLPPPTSTLFPYTTLFRSFLLLGGLLLFFWYAWESKGLARGPAGPGFAVRARSVPKVRFEDIGGQEVAKRELLEALQLDRKSTRLNSSHVKISYAVFCLKK